MTDYIRHKVGAVRPYICGPVSLPAFLSEVFGAEAMERHEFGPESFHIALRIGDSVVVVEAGELPANVAAWTNSIYVYVPDVDATYKRAIAMGAVSVSEPADKPYQERQAAFRDAASNTWWISTCKL